MGKVVASHAVMFFEVADDRLDGGAPFELALDLRRDAALLAGRVDLELVIGRGVVAAITGIGDAAIEDVADQRLHLWDDRGERVPVIGIAGQCCGMGDELPAGGMLHRGGDAHLDTELVRPVRLALTDALHDANRSVITNSPWTRSLGRCGGSQAAAEDRACGSPWLSTSVGPPRAAVGCKA